MTERAVPYCRVSSDEQRKSNLSITNQLRQCLEYVEKAGYSLADVGEYVDPESGQSAASGVPAFGEDASARVVTTPALTRALAAARKGAFDVLVAMSVDRISRGDQDILSNWRLQFAAYNVRIEYAQLPPTGDRATDKLVQTAFAYASNKENEARARRTREGKRLSAEKRGRHTGPAPFGYMSVDKKLEPDPETAEIAKSVFASYLKGSSLRQIARDLTAAKVPTGHGKAKWASQTIGRILKNPVYRGVYVFGSRQRVDGRTVAADRGREIEVPVPALVSEADWYRVQERLAESAATVRNHPTKRLYPLKGRIICAECRRSYVSQWNTGARREEYRHRRRDGGCSNHSLPADKVEGAVARKITEILFRKENLERTYEKAKKEYRERFGHIDDLLKRTRAMRAKQEAALDKLDASFLDPELGITKGRYLVLKDEITKKLAALDSEIASLESEKGESSEPPNLKDLEAWTAELRLLILPDMATPKDLRTVAALHGTKPEEVWAWTKGREGGPNRGEWAAIFENVNVRVEVDRPAKRYRIRLLGSSEGQSAKLGSRLRLLTFDLDLAA